MFRSDSMIAYLLFSSRGTQGELVTFLTRYSGFVRARWCLPRSCQGLAVTSPPHVFLVASGPRWHTLPRELCQRYEADPARGRALAGSGPDVWRPENRRDMSGHPQTAAGLVDVRAPCGGRTDQ